MIDWVAASSAVKAALTTMLIRETTFIDTSITI